MTTRMTFATRLAATLLAAASFSALAQPTAPVTPRVDAREAKQAARIEKGQASGALTTRETRRLQREQKGIAHAESHAKADGVVTPVERQRLARLQNKASNDIRRQKHDAQAVGR